MTTEWHQQNECIPYYRNMCILMSPQRSNWQLSCWSYGFNTFIQWPEPSRVLTFSLGILKPGRWVTSLHRWHMQSWLIHFSWFPLTPFNHVRKTWTDELFCANDGLGSTAICVMLLTVADWARRKGWKWRAQEGICELYWTQFTVHPSPSLVSAFQGFAVCLLDISVVILQFGPQIQTLKGQ